MVLIVDTHIYSLMIIIQFKNSNNQAVNSDYRLKAIYLTNIF